MSPTMFQDLVDSLEACVRQLVETAAYDAARKGEDPGLLETVETAQRVIARAKGLDSGDWSGSPCPEDPDNYWIDDRTGERIKAG